MSDPTPAAPIIDCQPWPVTYLCDVSEVAPDVLARVTATAEMLLWAAFGRRHGVCSYDRFIERGGCGCNAWASSFPFVPYLSDGVWRNAQCDPCAADCCALRLPHSPVQEVTAVWIDGVELPTESWWSDDRFVFLRSGCWPIDARCAEPRVRIQWTAGIAPPPGADAALGELACELLAAEQGRACRLPSRVTNISRQGVTMDLGSAEQFIDFGLFGLPLVDSMIRSLNPARLSQPSGVYSVDR